MGAQLDVPSMKKSPKFSRCRRRNKVVGRVVLSGQDHYTKSEWGPDDLPSPECLQEYLGFLESWKARGCAPVTRAVCPSEPSTMVDLVGNYAAHLKESGLYRRAGKPTTAWRFLEPTFASFKAAFKGVPLSRFGRVHLTAYRASQEALVAQVKQMPRHANRRLRRLRDMVIWGVNHGYLPESAGWSADHLEPIRDSLHHDVIVARTHPKRAVSPEDAEAVAAVCSDLYGTMVRLQRVVGCRPGELCAMRKSELDRGTPGWIKWVPSRHKTQHHGHSVVYWLNQAAQDILEPWLKTVTMGDFVFRKQSPVAQAGPVSTANYLTAVESACVRAGVARFTPHELRHAVATERANDPNISLAVAGRSLGHRRVTSLQPYVHDDDDSIRRAIS